MRGWLLVLIALLLASVAVFGVTGPQGQSSLAGGAFCVPTSGNLGSLGYSASHKALDIITTQGANSEAVYAARAGMIKVGVAGRLRRAFPWPRN